MVLRGCLALCLAAAGLGAADAGRANNMRDYVYTKDNTDLFIGEGSADLKEFPGSPAKAREAAHQRAKAALAESVRARISSDTTEKSSLKDGKTEEELKSTVQSQADVVLENMRFKDYDEFPETGTYTCLAMLDKADYRRQLAGRKAQVYLIERSFGMGLGLHSYDWVEKLRAELASVPGGASSSMPAGYNASDLGTVKSDPEISASFGYRGWSLGAAWQQLQVSGWFPAASGAQYQARTATYNINSVFMGYDYTPWATRVQLHLPVGLNWGYITGDQGPFWVGGGGLGVGLRYWVTEFLVFDAGATQSFGIYHSWVGSGTVTPNAYNDIGTQGHDFYAQAILAGY